MQNRANIYDNRLVKEIKSDIGGLKSGLQMCIACALYEISHLGVWGMMQWDQMKQALWDEIHLKSHMPVARRKICIP